MNETLKQADLSNRSLKDMTPAERAELRRRFNAFVSGIFGRDRATAPEKPKQVRKWVPGMKA